MHLINTVQNIDPREFVCERIEHGIADKEIVTASSSDVLDSLNSSKVPLSTKVGDSVGSKNIAQMWQDHFSDLINSVQNIDPREFICERIEHGIADKEIVTASSSDVLDSLKAVNLGNAAGIDGLSDLHFECAHIGISVHLSLLFTSMLTQ